VAIAERLRAMLRASDTVARVGGDEFVAVLTTVKDGRDIALAARKIIEECSKPLTIEDSQCRIGFSMGIALFPDDGDTIELIVNAADAAMYRVKQKNKNGYAFARGGDIEMAIQAGPRR
jgi:diguanylate cyclase (GGDEF)-like protein